MDDPFDIVVAGGCENMSMAPFLLPKARFGYRMGSGVLVDGSEEAIVSETNAILREAGTARFILGADCTLPDNVELWRVRAAKRAAQDFQ